MVQGPQVNKDTFIREAVQGLRACLSGFKGKDQSSFWANLNSLLHSQKQDPHEKDDNDDDKNNRDKTLGKKEVPLQEEPQDLPFGCCSSHELMMVIFIKDSVEEVLALEGSRPLNDWHLPMIDCDCMAFCFSIKLGMNDVVFTS